MKNALSLAAGAFLATTAFWIVIITLIPDLPANVLRSTGVVIVGDDIQVEKTLGAVAIDVLQKNGLGISADSYVGHLTDFYATILQLSLAAFVLFGVISYFAIRWQSVQSARDMISEQLDSEAFKQRLKADAQETFDLSIEPLERDIQGFRELSARVEAVERTIADSSSDEEPAEPRVRRASAALARAKKRE